jgi:hypothetical protein
LVGFHAGPGCSTTTFGTLVYLAFFTDVLYGLFVVRCPPFPHLFVRVVVPCVTYRIPACYTVPCATFMADLRARHCGTQFTVTCVRRWLTRCWRTRSADVPHHCVLLPFVLRLIPFRCYAVRTYGWLGPVGCDVRYGPEPCWCHHTVHHTTLYGLRRWVYLRRAVRLFTVTPAWHSRCSCDVPFTASASCHYLFWAWFTTLLHSSTLRFYAVPFRARPFSTLRAFVGLGTLSRFTTTRSAHSATTPDTIFPVRSVRGTRWTCTATFGAVVLVVHTTWFTILQHPTVLFTRGASPSASPLLPSNGVAGIAAFPVSPFPDVRCLVFPSHSHERLWLLLRTALVHSVISYGGTLASCLGVDSSYYRDVVLWLARGATYCCMRYSPVPGCSGTYPRELYHSHSLVWRLGD